MEEKDQTQAPKPGLPEAIYPEIGNGAMWETDPHLWNLRSIDPASVLDNLLLDESSKLAIIQKWKEQILKSPSLQVEDNTHENIPITIDNSGEIIESIQSGPSGYEEDQIEPDLPPTPVEGKRVRKAVKKAQKQKKRLEKAEKTPVQESLESNLSPFTRWLKSLRGSEYVHPYEDDYGLDQLPVSQGDGISETFADLLMTQGYKDQAIDMYKLLMAKYPEKSSFFAAKIEGLQ